MKCIYLFYQHAGGARRAELKARHFPRAPSYRAAASSHSDVERAARKNTRKYLLHSYRYIELPYIEIQAEYLRIRTGGAAGGGGLGISRIPGFLNSWMFSVGGDGPSDGLDV